MFQRYLIKILGASGVIIDRLSSFNAEPQGDSSFREYHLRYTMSKARVAAQKLTRLTYIDCFFYWNWHLELAS